MEFKVRIKAITNKREFIFNTEGFKSPSSIAKQYLNKGEALVKLIAL